MLVPCAGKGGSSVLADKMVPFTVTLIFLSLVSLEPAMEPHSVLQACAVCMCCQWCSFLSLASAVRGGQLTAMGSVGMGLLACDWSMLIHSECMTQARLVVKCEVV